MTDNLDRADESVDRFREAFGGDYEEKRLAWLLALGSTLFLFAVIGLYFFVFLPQRTTKREVTEVQQKLIKVKEAGPCRARGIDDPECRQQADLILRAWCKVHHYPHGSICDYYRPKPTKGGGATSRDQTSHRQTGRAPARPQAVLLRAVGWLDPTFPDPHRSKASPWPRP